MKVIGIGNAIVDVICKVEENFLTNNKLTKSTMKLVDENEFSKLLSNLKIEETVSGGYLPFCSDSRTNLGLEKMSLRY